MLFVVLNISVKVDTVSDLGVIFDSKLACLNHINEKVNKPRYQIVIYRRFVLDARSAA